MLTLQHPVGVLSLQFSPITVSLFLLLPVGKYIHFKVLLSPGLALFACIIFLLQWFVRTNSCCMSIWNVYGCAGKYCLGKYCLWIWGAEGHLSALAPFCFGLASTVMIMYLATIFHDPIWKGLSHVCCWQESMLWKMIGSLAFKK